MSTDIGLKFYYENVGKYTTVSEMFSLSPVFAIHLKHPLRWYKNLPLMSLTASTKYKALC